ALSHRCVRGAARDIGHPAGGVVRDRRRDRDRLGGAGMSLAVLNPRTGEADDSIDPIDGPAIAALAARLRAGQPGWAASGAEARGDALRGLADAMGRYRSALIEALTADTGRAAISLIEVGAMI